MHRDRDRLLQLLILNEEFLVIAVHQTAMITSLPFVHTARRTYRLNGPVRTRDCGLAPSLGPDRENLSEPYHLEEGEVVTLNGPVKSSDRGLILHWIGLLEVD